MEAVFHVIIEKDEPDGGRRQIVKHFHQHAAELLVGADGSIQGSGKAPPVLPPYRIRVSVLEGQ